MGRMGSLSGGQPYTEDSASEMAALLSSTSLPFLSTHPHFPTHLLSFLIFFLLPLSIYAEQQRITVKPEVTAYNVALPPLPNQVKNVTVGGDAVMKCTVANR